MSLYRLKPRFQALLRPFAHLLYRLGATANQVTLTACAGSLLVGGGLALSASAGQTGWFLLLPGWFFLRMALNAIDGMLAREFAQRSRLGAYLNELCDQVSDAALYLPFAFLSQAGGALPVLVVVLIVLANLAEMAGVLAIGASGERRNDGPLGKSDRAFVFSVLGLLLACGVRPGEWLVWALAAITVLLVLTIVNRVQRGVAESSGSAGADSPAEQTSSPIRQGET
ncbi:CDP-alcohol phosphatidyltransferase family protein [Accumulibacter sp.]|uniref:CDP-alcohol phosphatidyltransferase family protein n=2 Tax=Accumulibacter sp. TaxID=2053492 RepID=UPI00261906DC|nr:CDP-alcohol phosphatidyltransferase family protein [Accumulibacter sp.]